MFPGWQYSTHTVTHGHQEGNRILTPWKRTETTDLEFSQILPQESLLLVDFDLYPFPVVEHSCEDTALSEFCRVLPAA